MNWLTFLLFIFVLFLSAVCVSAAPRLGVGCLFRVADFCRCMAVACPHVSAWQVLGADMN